MSGIIAGIVALLGLLFFSNSRRKSAEALLENAKSKEEVNSIESDKQKNNASLQLEEERREDIKKNAEEKSNNPSDSVVLDFLNGKK